MCECLEYEDGEIHLCVVCADEWRSLRLALETATRERDEARDTAAFLLELLRAVVKTGTKDPLLDARLTEELRSHE